MTELTVDVAAILRAPFPPEKVGKLPRVTCGPCRDSRSRVCDKHQKARCEGCGSWITTGHIHLDYVGHADVTDRLLEVDPSWTWEPLALDANGLPLIDGNGGMWIRLTVAGVTRIGYGDADGKRGGSAVKETIGDALRNASMRFGVALDLWRKEFHDDDRPARAAEPARRTRRESHAEKKDRAHKAIAEAPSVERLRELLVQVDARVDDGTFSPGDAADLREHVERRVAELAGVEAEPEGGAP